MELATADLFDKFGDELQSCELQFRNYGLKTRFHGEICTLSCREDNFLVREMLTSQGNGRVLVVDGSGSLRSALMGDVLAEAGRRNGWSGVIINGAIRDVEVIGTMEFGVRALGSNPRKSSKAGGGIINQPVCFGTVTFIPGHFVYCDADGIVVARRALHHSHI